MKPKHIIAFTADPGEECEPANFGLCLYPAIIFVPDPKTGHQLQVTDGVEGLVLVVVL